MALKDLHVDYLLEMWRLAVVVGGDSNGEEEKGINKMKERGERREKAIGEKMLRGLASHYKWEFDRSGIVDRLVSKAI